MAAKPPAQRDSVGYGKPPVETRFPKGQSGNPKGRPSGAKNLITIMTEELAQLVTATENGKRRRLSMGRAIIKRLTASAAGGSLRAAEILLRHASGMPADPTAETVSNQSSLSEPDEAILKRALARMNTATSGHERRR